MKRLQIAGLLFLFLGAGLRAETPSVALTHVTVIDPASSGTRNDQTVVISGNRIARISPEPPPENSKVIDAKGKFLIPGLCDMHVHVAGVSADPRWSRETLLPLLVANGITAVRDMGGDLAALQDWRRQIEAGRLVGPRIYASGPMLDRGTSELPSLLGVNSPNEGRTAVRELKAKGADFIKVLSRLDRETYFAIADEAKKQQMTLIGHVPSSISAIEASNAGQKSIEHIFYSDLTFDCSSREVELRKKSAAARAARDSAAAGAARDEANGSFDAEKAKTVWQTLVRNHTSVVPTLIAIQATSQRRELAQSSPAELAYLPLKLRQSWSLQEIEKEVSPAIEKWYDAQFQNDLKLARSMHQAGVQMMAGSDSLDPFNFPGPSLHGELQLLCEAGFTPFEALQAATSFPAHFLGADGEEGWGTIQPGKMANLVLLDANPIDSIANTKKIFAVVINGKFLGRPELDQLLVEARTAADKVR